MIDTPASGQIWDEATTPEALQRAQEFEARWRAAADGRRPDLADFLDGPDGRPGGAGVLLALLRADLALRRGTAEAVPLEAYRDRHPGLRDDVLVALIYEDFCLREELGGRPDPGEYYARFPALAGPLREILDIHDLIRTSTPPGTRPGEPADPPGDFPESGQTIGGFFLVAELGRGSFARVFLARERQLADRPVALKVSRTGSREPQALARLQHTNIVPVHSYRVDPGTDLHLLCMPYFGRVTLDRLLADPSLRAARGGDAVVATLDRLVAAEGRPGAGRQAARAALARRTFPRAIAWWGARMADALRHAHDRGVLHRDLKPSNILIAADGTPMLLDFNLAREVGLAAADPTRVGGTLAYMAPEHLEALIDGRDEGIDHRADLYALGLILAEMLGTKPLGDPPPSLSPRDLLDRRRRPPPELERGAVPVPPAFAAVIRRCLAAGPADRYASAHDLAADLEAVADDAPLRFAREPWPPRAARWVRQNRGVLVGFALILAVITGVMIAWFRARADALRVEAAVRELVRDGTRAAAGGEFRAAAVQFAQAAARAEGHPELAGPRRDALDRRGAAEAAEAARVRADAFLGRAELLRFAVLGFVGDPAAASRDLVAAFGPLGVLGDPDWAAGPALARLDPGRRSRLIRAVDDLLFFWVVAAARNPDVPGEDPARRVERAVNAVAYCDKALAFTDQPGPWRALRDWWRFGPASGPPAPGPFGPAGGGDAAACFRWFLLGTLGTDRGPALAWLDRAARLEPGNYWHRFAMAFEHERGGDLEVARSHYDAAIALRPDFPWAWKNRGLLAGRLEDWGTALADLARARDVCPTPADAAGVVAELGLVHQRLGDFRAARAAYAAAIAADPAGAAARVARRNRARLEADSGDTPRAMAAYDELIAADPDDWRSRQGRARLALRGGQLGAGLRDLDRAIDATRGRSRASCLLDRAAGRLAAGQPAEARADAADSVAIHPTAAAVRLLDRIKLALGEDLDEWPDSPAAFDAMTPGGPRLRADLGRAADRLHAAAAGRPPDLALGLERSILLSAADDHESALDAVDRIARDFPAAVEARLARARIERRAGRPARALAAIADGLAGRPEEPRLVELRGLIRIEAGDLAAGCVDLAVAFERGIASARGAALAGALDRQGRPAAAAAIWAQRVEADPGDARAHLGLADARRHLRRWDAALASLEDALALVEPRSPLFGRATLAYAACLPARPSRIGRVAGLARRYVAARVPRPAGPDG